MCETFRTACGSDDSHDIVGAQRSDGLMTDAAGAAAGFASGAVICYVQCHVRGRVHGQQVRACVLTPSLCMSALPCMATEFRCMCMTGSCASAAHHSFHNEPYTALAHGTPKPLIAMLEYPAFTR